MKLPAALRRDRALLSGEAVKIWLRRPGKNTIIFSTFVQSKKTGHLKNNHYGKAI